MVTDDLRAGGLEGGGTNISGVAGLPTNSEGSRSPQCGERVLEALKFRFDELGFFSSSLLAHAEMCVSPRLPPRLLWGGGIRFGSGQSVPLFGNVSSIPMHRAGSAPASTFPSDTCPLDLRVIDRVNY